MEPNLSTRSLRRPEYGPGTMRQSGAFRHCALCLIAVLAALLFVPAARASTFGNQPTDNDTVIINGNTLVFDGFTVSTEAGTVTLDSLQVGDWGTASFTITDGGKLVVGPYSTGISDWMPSYGIVTVNGSGSSFTTNGLNFGNTDIFGTAYGTGILSISDGGTVSASSIGSDAKSTISVDVGRGSSLVVGGGAGSIGSNGVIRLTAGVAAAPGTYTPMLYGALSGAVQAVGGVWNSAAHTVTVNPVVTAAAGAAATINLSKNQRILFTDSATGKSAGASFMATTTSTPLTLTASAMSKTELALLQSVLGSGRSVLSGWDFTAGSGYTEGDPAYLSLWAGAGQSLYTLSIWHYDGSNWSAYSATDLAYDNTYASFTVTGFSDYAVTGTSPVPIPAAAWLLCSGLVGLGAMRGRTRRRKKAFGEDGPNAAREKGGNDHETR